MSGYLGPERRSRALSEDEMDLIATKAAEKALEKVYAEVGRGLLKKAAWVVGAIVVGLLMWMGGKGIPIK
jgi:hypothetical protein